MATNDVTLPNEDELTVPEVNLSSPALRAGAFHMGKFCESQNNVRQFWTNIVTSSPSKQMKMVAGIHVVQKGAERSTKVFGRGTRRYSLRSGLLP